MNKQALAKSIGERLRVKRGKISQEELASRAGFYRTYIGHLEVGRYMPSAYTIYKICKALKIKSSELLPF